MTRYSLFAAALTLLVAAPGAYAVSPMAPGLWEITVKMEMPGMPGRMPPITRQRCYTATELSRPDAGVPQSDSKCKVDNVNQTSSSTSWRVTCNGPQGNMTGDGHIQFKDKNSYDGSMKISMAGGAGGANMQMTQSYSGRRLGDCAAQ